MNNSEITEPKTSKPAYVTALEAAYGTPSQAGFGSAVFTQHLPAGADLEQAALEKYRYFVGEQWERFGEAAWMDPWKEVYARQAGIPFNIVAELRSIKDHAAAISVPLILDDLDDAENARAALSLAYDDPAVTDLRVYRLGDGRAISGLLIAGRHQAGGETIILVFLLD